VYTVDVTGSTNRELFASDNPDMLKVLSENTEKLENENLSFMMKNISADIVRYENGNRILTDDKAPVELLGMSVIDDIIQDELVYYREKFKTEGIKGIIG
ncbi:MAG: spermidine synthase, partial [Ruminococcus sp.]|nr:spermidine synthase [Ruminococcus sp.]